MAGLGERTVGVVKPLGAMPSLGSLAALLSPDLPFFLFFRGFSTPSSGRLFDLPASLTGVEVDLSRELFDEARPAELVFMSTGHHRVLIQRSFTAESDKF
jgi:hypothetical protein